MSKEHKNNMKELMVLRMVIKEIMTERSGGKDWKITQIW